MHGLRLMIKEEALIISDQLIFPAVTELAKRGLLSPETWHCNRASALRPRLTSQGTVIEQNGDGLLEESHMPVGWPFFRPTPSWLSPGRSTCFVACCKMGLID